VVEVVDLLRILLSLVLLQDLQEMVLPQLVRKAELADSPEVVVADRGIQIPV
jgi:hypothetical protein